MAKKTPQQNLPSLENYSILPFFEAFGHRNKHFLHKFSVRKLAGIWKIPLFVPKHYKILVRILTASVILSECIWNIKLIKIGNNIIEPLFLNFHTLLFVAVFFDDEGNTLSWVIAANIIYQKCYFSIGFKLWMPYPRSGKNDQRWCWEITSVLWIYPSSYC